jgi:hypothetical protein
MHLKIIVGNETVIASIINSKTSDDFIRLLPFSFRMDDLFGREKYGALPKSISTKSRPSYRYEVGDIGYWSPGHDLAIYYKHDGEAIPDPGIIIVGKIISDIEALSASGPVNVKIELAE